MNVNDKHTPAGRGQLAAVGALLVVVAGLLLAPAAGAQEDPYGSTTTTAATQVSAACSLSSSAGSANAQVTATVSGVPVGEVVRILFDGDEVGRGTAEGDGQSATTTVQIGFTVPDVEQGAYSVVAVGASFSAECSAGFGTGASVLGFTVDRATTGSGKVSGKSGAGALASTGLAVGLLVAVAIALLVVGRSLRDQSRRLDARLAGTADRTPPE